PTAATTAPETAASATGPRKNSPGVKISPTASSAAAIDHASHPAIRSEPMQTEDRWQRVQVFDVGLVVLTKVETVDEYRLHPQSERTLDVGLDRVADHGGFRRRHVEQVEDGAKDRRVWLRLAVMERSDARVDGERVMARNCGA